MSRKLYVVILLSVLVIRAEAATVSVNSTDSGNVEDAVVTLSEAIAIVNGSLERELTDGEAAQVSGALGTDDRIHFAIPGDGPHTIPANLPEGGGALQITANDVIVDGYTQAGASPNTNGRLEANNAVLQIIIDASDGTYTGSGGGDNSGDIVTIFGNNVIIRGFSFLSAMSTEAGGSNWGVNWRDGASGGQFAGNWLGVHPDGQTVSGGEIGIGACSTAGGHVFGTNGDGVDDVAEFNVIAGFNVNTIVEGALDVTIAGNKIGLLPDGVSALPQAAQDAIGEGDAVEGGGLDGLVFGTNGDGVADDLEGNVVGSMKDEAVQFYFGSNEGVKISGNYFGVGVDGTTAHPSKEFFDLGGTSCRGCIIGSDFDGMSDDLEANTIANFTGELFHYPPDSLVSLRGNTMFNNAGPIHADLDRSFHFSQLNRTEDIAPTLQSATDSLLVGEIPLAQEADVDPMTVDLYLADSGSDAPQGMTYLGTFADDGPEDSDSSVGGFEFDISGVAGAIPPGSFLVVAANVPGELFGMPGAETSPFSNLLGVAGPFIRGDCQQNGTVELTDGVFILNRSFTGGPAPACQAACDFNGDGSFDITNAVYLFSFLFQGGPGMPPPIGTAGLSSEPDDVASGCDTPQ